MTSGGVTVVTLPAAAAAPQVVSTATAPDAPTAVGRVPAPVDLSGARVVAFADTAPGGGGSGGSPSGLAGGVLGGTYPNPTFAVPMATTANLTAHVTSTTPHPAYDDLPSLTLRFLNGLV